MKLKKIKSVDSSLYNKTYFKGINFGKVDPRTESTYPKKYLEMLNLCPIMGKDKIVDFGCGNGLLSLILAYKSNNEVIGIDYSKDAIENSVANQKIFQKQIGRTLKLNYLQKDNLHLPNLKNITHIFLSDVVEHLYDEEIICIFDRFKTWGSNLKIIIHTDNSYYLNYVKPIQDMFALIARKTNINEIRFGYTLNAKYHVNITNPQKLNRLLATLGYKNTQIIYPEATDDAISRQIGQILDFPFIYKIIRKILTNSLLRQLLSPGFYAIYEYKTTS